MVKADLEPLAQRLEELTDVFDRKRPSNEMLRGYFAALKEFALPEVLGALEYALRYSKKMPTPACVIERIGLMRVERADAEHRRRVRDEAEVAARTFAPSESGTAQLQRLLNRLTHASRTEPKAWAQALQRKARSGQYVPIACQQGAARALGVSLAEFQGRAEVAPETEDQREARLEREALMGEGAPA